MKNFLIFALGAAVGSLVTWKIVEEKYKKLADEEIESVVERFNNRINEEKTKEAEDEKVVDYKEQVRELDYDKEEDGYTIVTEPEEDFIKPYVISPEEFGEFGDKTRSFMYYADFVLADEDDYMVDNPESLIGDALEHFGEYEDDSVHVRNENIGCDFEILRSEKTFSEVNKGDN